MPNDFNTNDDLLDDELIDGVQPAEVHDDPTIPMNMHGMADDAMINETVSAEENSPHVVDPKYTPQEVWFAKTSRTNLEKIYLKGEDHVKNPVCSEFESKLRDGWRLHTMHLASNDMDVFIVLTRG